jgi:DNA-binding NarL/FixJ family response regulator
MKKILIIEDEPQTRRNIATILEMEGYSPVTAAEGRTGLALARELAPQLILCDVSMPEMDGHEVLKALRADARTACIPFLFLTARTDRKDVRTGMELGADDYLYKPARVDELLGAVRSRLERKQELVEAIRETIDLTTDFSSPAPLEGLGLTPREAEVLLWVAQGKSNFDVATIIGAAEKTIKAHLSNIFEKLSVESRNAATVIAIETLNNMKRKERPVA